MDENEKNSSEIEMSSRTFLETNKENIIVITRGHPFERDPFFEMIDSTGFAWSHICLLYTSPSPRDRTRSRMPSSA